MPRLTDDDRNRWSRDGFVVSRSFLETDQLDRLLTWVAEVADWPVSDEAWMHHFERTEAGPRLCRSENFVPYHEELRRLLTTGPVVEAVGELLGEPAVLYKEKINYKYPGGGGYAAHQDAPAYRFINNHVTCLLAVDRATSANGCLFFSPGLHTDGLLALDHRGCIEEETASTLSWDPAELEPGDALFFSSYAPHYSPPNTTDQARRALYLTYNAASEGDRHDEYYREKRESFAEAKKSGDASSTYISKIGHFQGTTVSPSTP